MVMAATRTSQSAAKRRLTRGILAQAGLHHVAHDHFVDGFGSMPARRTASATTFAPSSGAESGDSPPMKFADRRAHRAQNDWLFHDDDSFVVRADCPLE